MLKGLDLAGMIITLDACTSSGTPPDSSSMTTAATTW